MSPDQYGRLYKCGYCGAEVQVGVDASQIAAGMRLDLTNMEVFLAELANTLSQGFAEHTRIEAKGRVVMSIEVDLDPDVFAARREGKHVVASHKRVVRGIALKTQTLPLDRWVNLLTEALARHANQNARAAWVLGRLTGSGGGGGS
jgi:hypothetical protein